MSSFPIRRFVSAIGALVALLCAIGLPVGFGVISYQNEAEALSFHAHLNARYIAKYVYQVGPMWTFHKVRLAEVVELNNSRETKNRQYRVYASDGALVVTEGDAVRTPTIFRDTPIVVRGNVIGRVEVEASARPLLISTGPVIVLGFCLGFLVYYFARVLPIRLLDKTVGALEAKSEAALTNMSQGLAMFDADQRLVICNRQYADMYGLSPTLVKPGITLRQILECRIAAGYYEGVSATRFIEDRLAIAASGKPSVKITEMSDGRAISISHKPLENGGFITVHEDITELKRADAQIAHMAHHDALTNLPNRVLLREEMERALTRVGRGDKLAVLCLDLDHFKGVNDMLGHPIGDVLLQQVAERLRSCVRDTDTVARLGGDEFAILQVGADQPHEATLLSQRIIEVLAVPYDLQGHQIVIGASVGIALAPNDSENSDQLLKAADMALYRAKTEGRATYHFFEPEMDDRMQARRALEIDLRKALPQSELEMFYQPLVDIETHRISGFEALMRWSHPDRGMVPPDVFIPLAEEIGLIGLIGGWALKQACREAMNWPSDVKLAVNLSPAQFKSRTLVLDVIAALGTSGLSAKRLELEITETALLQDTDRILATLHELRALGVSISMDDFGTGYSSLSYLQKFPFDKIKIDRSFVNGLPDQADSLAIIRAVLGLGASLKMSTTAEGVETKEQLDRLRSEGCTEVQGYFFSPARPASEIAGLLFNMSTKSREAA